MEAVMVSQLPPVQVGEAVVAVIMLEAAAAETL
jgi:hypothetical protein